ncbi:hypothetical protein [Borrelia persica]|uniref:hypothetical protein n=1 Tax=Borrelia persica TaxID=44448 RepID=UPI0004677C4B|nr:hypothetical protein [Borrelia persica]
MTGNGKLSAYNANRCSTSSIAASAVRVLIRQAVNFWLGAIREAVKGIKYSETYRTNALEVGTI